jgi:hypothetical protein
MMILPRMSQTNNTWQSLDLVLQQLHSPNSVLLAEGKHRDTLEKRLSELSVAHALLAVCQAELPPPLAQGLLAATTRRNALQLLAANHAAASSLYQWQTTLLACTNAYFNAKSAANQTAPLDEVRISTKPMHMAVMSHRAKSKSAIPPEARQSLRRLQQTLPPGALHEAVERLLKLTSAQPVTGQMSHASQD